MTRTDQDRVRQRKGEANKRIAQAARKWIAEAKSGRCTSLFALVQIDSTVREVDAGQPRAD